MTPGQGGLGVPDPDRLLVPRFLANVRRTPERAAVISVRRRGTGTVEDVLTYGELDRAAGVLGRRLAAEHAPGERVMLMLQDPLTFVRAFFACQYARLVPVPVPLPESSRPHSDRAGGIALDCRPSLVLTDAEHHPQVSAWLCRDGLETVPVAVVGAEPVADTEPGGPARSSLPTDLAFLQYTSGSTSDPKGVMVTQANLAHNIAVGQALLGWDAETRTGSWLPVYHDMGLISMLLAPLRLGGSAVQMPAADFLKHPYAWLELIDRYGVHASGAPNFGYDLCLRRVTDEQLAGLDLSRWRWACNGAEPIDPNTVRRFAERFATAGFRAEALVAGYGLAEATLFVTGSRAGAYPVVTAVDPAALARDELRADPAGTGQGLVGCGRTHDLDVRVVDPTTRVALPDGRIGEIWIRGESVAAGYWERPEESGATFAAATASGDGGFLRTGDLGGVLDGELYLTGRIKELLIVHGRNLYPQDIERVVRDELPPPHRAMPCCAFAVDLGPGAEVVILQEVRRRSVAPDELERLAKTLRAAVTRRLGVRVAAVSLVRMGQVRRTTSGKVRRRQMRELFMAGELVTVHEDLDDDLRQRYRYRAPAVAPA